MTSILVALFGAVFLFGALIAWASYHRKEK